MSTEHPTVPRTRRWLDAVRPALKGYDVPDELVAAVKADDASAIVAWVESEEAAARRVREAFRAKWPLLERRLRAYEAEWARTLRSEELTIDRTDPELAWYMEELSDLDERIRVLIWCHQQVRYVAGIDQRPIPWRYKLSHPELDDLPER
jgi:hypothetical protein